MTNATTNGGADVLIGTDNFTPSEFKCKCGCGSNLTQQRLINSLQQARNRINKPIKIVSGYRCPEHNKAVGGKSNSAHTKGMAADIHCTNDRYRYALVFSLLKAGCERIGVYKTFVHADLDHFLPSDVMWIG